ncbi:hypothetical protein [Criblamydia sequanensis]|uniref:Uncharacterized protein n=1 Tax=Candidatus Criblamydia sequanensis CRIB-18 TaxID=1437425 RepID=A0A090E2Z9_9BACT|nr:hypothetical protein [Criblamydia sequanensis]CDR35009.1 hypothetical protein CSEC_2203 [Criblamydia sequanensis CRIB-18]
MNYARNQLIGSVVYKSTKKACNWCSQKLTRQTINKVSKDTNKIAERILVKDHLNRFHQAAENLTEIGQTNIRSLRGWAKSKGWRRFPNDGGPEKWGNLETRTWHVIIKPEASFRPGLQSGSNIPRFDARINHGQYINPFTGKVGGKEVGTHLPLEIRY